MAYGLLFLCSLFLVSYSYQLAPFIAWSNSDIVQDLPISDDINIIVHSLVTEIDSIDKVVIFTSDELSFDEFNKYAGVYDETKQSQLKASIESSVSHYWTGTQIAVNDDWISVLADKGHIQYMNSDDIHDFSGQKFVMVKLPDLSSQDNVIASVMKEAQGLSFLAIYTHSSLIKHRAQRDIEDHDDIEVRAITPSLGAANDNNNNNNNNTKCRMGGQFFEPGINSTTSCLLFCLGNITYNFTLDGEPEVMCILDKPNSISACCADQNYTTGCYGDVPYVQFNFTVGSTNTSDNMCSNTSFNFDTANIGLKFLFPYTHNQSSMWFVMMESSLSIVNDSTSNNIEEYFDNITRTNPSINLYQAFELNEGLSYACAANEFNRYVQMFNQSNKTVSVMLHSFQVQPYAVKTNTFASAYNCEGYFTSTTWMGIVTVVILLLILYLSLLCVFSLRTIDKFEDPRGQSISVEKLH